MSGSSSNQDIFDVRKIRRLVELMKEHDLNEIDLRQQDMRIQLRRGSLANPSLSTYPHMAAASLPVEVTPQPSAATMSSAQSKPEPDAGTEDNYVEVKCPMVGTFYAASDPEAAPFVKPGDHVGPETTVCIIEAMKVFNEIPAETSGKIVAVLAKNGEPVEFGQPLFKVDVQG